ncbi:MAG: CHAT domain-containing protein, partial [Saprospiraceae bacterium]
QQSTSPVNAYLFARPVALAKILPALSYDQALFQKGFLMNAARRLQALSITSTEASTIKNYLKGYRRRLAAEYTKPIAERKGIAELEENANLAEKELARTVAGYADALRQVKWEEVKSGLKQQEAAIEFVYFEVGFPQKTDSMMYAALLILPGAEQPMFIPLFEEKELQKKMSKKITPQHQELVAQMYTRGLVPLGGNNNQEGLYDLLWKPLDSLLAGIKKIYYSPAGMLHQINFNAIPVGYDANDEVLILADKYELVRLGSTRSIVVPDVTQINAANEMSLYGGIHYEIDTTLHTFTDSILHKNNNYPSNFTYALRSVPNRGGAWNYLPGTEHEIAEIFSIGERAHYPISIYQGSNAKEETVKELGKGKPSPRILHIATHGFFFPNPVINKEAHGLGATESIFKLSDNPMIRSGLMLAGSNYTWKKGRPWRDGMEDGILTAYEISQMNLSNTELVVLSACETGLGDIQGNEGVYGLQRAFKIAGAKYLMMSLWQVPDEETKEFMIGFYKNWLEKKLSIPDAFRITQKEMHEKYTNPYLWAGFVLVE